MLKTKKGAMLGLEARGLRKQSGGLFLTRLRRLTFRLVEGQQATRVLTAKGAMFGLDARIALAIFGALSVISGAALYSAIQEAKTVAYLNELREIAKAEEQYFLDVGYPLSEGSPGNSLRSADELIVNSENKKGWKGPYLPYDIFGFGFENTTSSHRFFISQLRSNDWTGSTVSGDIDCVVNVPCGVWVASIAISDTDLINGVDTKVDGSVDAMNGNIRYFLGAIYYFIRPKV